MIARCRKPGAESDIPTLANATLPDLRKNLRFITAPLLGFASNFLCHKEAQEAQGFFANTLMPFALLCG
jgi:hypothetical protein